MGKTFPRRMGWTQRKGRPGTSRFWRIIDTDELEAKPEYTVTL